jgi:hypothetical protein
MQMLIALVPPESTLRAKRNLGTARVMRQRAILDLFCFFILEPSKPPVLWRHRSAAHFTAKRSISKRSDQHVVAARAVPTVDNNFFALFTTS